MRRTRSRPRSVAIWLPRWPIQRLLRDEPELSGRAVVLYESFRGGRRVCAVSQRAAQRGVHIDMPVAEATSLVERHERYVAAHDAAADRAMLEQLAGWCQRFSPLVALDIAEEKGARETAASGPQGLLLDVTGLPSLFGGEGAFARQIVRDFSREGWYVRVALADTAGTAWAMAHYGGGRTAVGRTVADRRSHRGSKLPREVPQIVPAGQSLAALAPLPVAALRLSEATVTRLASLGLITIGQVAELPRAALASRFDEELLRRLDEALGSREEATPAEHAAEPLVAACRFPAPTDRREVLEFAWQDLIDQLCRQLVQRGEGALRLECSLELEAGEPLLISLSTYRPVADARHLKDLLRLRWERQPLDQAAWRIEVSVPLTAPLERRQQTLFDATTTHSGGPGGEFTGQTTQRAVATLIDRLSSRLGREAVLSARLTGDAVPEYASLTRPLSGQRPLRTTARHRSSRQPQQPAKRPAGARPLWLVPRPLRVPVVATVVVAEHEREGTPIRFRLRGTDHVVARCWGPERIETGWWRGAAVRRDYYRVETTTGLRFWLFRCLRQQAWFLHGMFE
ncbi:MAG: DNA polymerase Y family protein [Planctomycetota bacterium]|nr:MAG: DNA polymerase Y family protein [Planctomycetota bacterium]REJ93833.1 MAG: DNA polymerase Y family protein [Planctomycetota bacterium]